MVTFSHIKINVFWDVTPCGNLVDRYQCFGWLLVHVDMFICFGGNSSTVKAREEGSL